MIVDSVPKLKEWLITELNNVTIDADVNAVAMYALALVKKDVPEKDLKPAVCSDLSVFLAENTEPFVTRLFQAVKDKSYITDGDEINDATTVTSPTEETTSEPLQRQESKAQESEPELSDEDRDHRRTVKKSPSNSPPPPRRRPSPHSRLGYNRPNRGYRGNSDYSGRGMRRDMRNRIGRGGYDNNRRYEGGISRRRSRSPRRSLSPRRRSRSPRSSPAPRKSLSPLRRSRSPLDLLATVGTKAKKDVKRKCRDYEEKGFCLSGDLCPFSHGNDAVVMTDVTGLSLASTSANTGIPAAPSAPVPPSQQTAIHPILPTVPPVPVEPYNPETPRMWPVNNPGPPRPGYMMGQPPLPQYPHQPRPPHLRQSHPRQAIPQQHLARQPPPRSQHPRQPRPPRPHHMAQSAPRMSLVGQDAQQMYRPGYTPAHHHQQGNPPRPAFFDPNNCTLEVKNLPVEFNNISKLNQHFSKFGEIMNLQVQYMSQIDTALVTYATHQSAALAHKNPEPVFNNRFIKIFWHNSNNYKQAEGTRPHPKSRLGTEIRPPTTAQPPQKPKVEANMNRATLRLDKSAAAASDSKKEVEQKRHSLLLKYIQEQKKMLKQAESCTDPKKKAEYMKMMKMLLTKIEQLKVKDDNQSTRASKAAKELLDTELDIHQKRVAGEDTASLQSKLEALKKQARSLGIRTRQGNGVRSLPRPPPPKQSLPTAIVVVGFASNEKDAVIAHFAQFGTVTEKEFKAEPQPTVVVEYTKANDAKVAATHGTKLGSKTLILKWYKPPVADAKTLPPAPKNSATFAASQMPAAGTSVPKSGVSMSKGSAGSGVDEQMTAKKPAASVSHDSVLDDDAEDLLAADEGNDEGDVDENLLLGDEEYEEDSDGKRSW